MRLPRSAFAVLLLVLACGVTSDPTPALHLDHAEARLSTVPAGVLCWRFVVQGGTTVDARFDVTPGAGAFFALKNLPTGPVTVNAQAYAQACSDWSSALAASWASDPLTDTIVTGNVAHWRLAMHRVAPVSSGPSNNSTIVATPSTGIAANGITQSAITVTLLDINQHPVSGVMPVLSVTGTGNTLSACSVSTSTGISACTLASTTAELKTVSFVSPLITPTTTVTFLPSPNFDCPYGAGTFGTVSATTSNTFTCRNTGGNVAITTPLSIQITGDSTFTLSNDYCSGVSLAGGQSCTFAVQFPAPSGNPVPGTSYSGTLRVAAFASSIGNGGGSVTWPLSGSVASGGGGGGGGCGTLYYGAPCTIQTQCASCVCNAGVCF